MPVPVIFMLCFFCLRVLDDNRDNKNNGKNENDGHPLFFTLVVFVVSVVV